MFCAARTKNGKGELCFRQVLSGIGNHTGPDGWVYYLCGQHWHMNVHGKNVVMEKHPNRGHAPLQPQLDINNPVHNAWANKEKTVINYNDIDLNTVQEKANFLYGTSHRMGQNRIVTSHSGQANDGSRIGDVFCGSDYVAHINLVQATIRFDRGLGVDETYALDEFIKDEDPVLGDISFPEFKVMCTGHRANAFTEIELTNLDGLLDRFFTSLKGMHPEEIITVISGGADGADRAFARGAVRKELEFDLFLPHEGYGENYFGTSRWFANMCNAARSIRYSSTADKFHWSMNFVRNIDMIKAADLHVVITSKSIKDLLTARRGGTSHAVKEMKKAGITQIVKINPARNTITWVPLQDQ